MPRFRTDQRPSLQSEQTTCPGGIASKENSDEHVSASPQSKVCGSVRSIRLWTDDFGRFSHQEKSPTIARRDLLKLFGLAGGIVATHPLLYTVRPAPPTTYTARPQLQNGNGKHVLILGAGLAGLTAAYELRQAGYRCTILEARERAGGRCWTIRNRTTITEQDSEAQTAQFAENLFFDAGADRIPLRHNGVLAYCKEFGVPLQSFVQLNTDAYYYHEDVGALSGQPVRIRQAWIDLRGHTFALLAKAIQQGQVDQYFDTMARKLLLAFLQTQGNLNDRYEYTGSTKAGFAVEPGAWEQTGSATEALPLNALLSSNFWQHPPFTMDAQDLWVHLQPRDGMDAPVQAFVAAVGDIIRYSAVVEEIRRTETGVRVLYSDGVGTQELQGDYCICTIPLPVLSAIATDFPTATQNAIRTIPYMPFVKVGLAFHRRFWEEDEHIYAGGTFTNLNIGQIWYPVQGLLGKHGLVQGAYQWGEAADALGAMHPAQRVAEAVRQGAKIHPPYRDELEGGLSVAWQKLPYNQGAWAIYDDTTRAEQYPHLFDFDERIHLAGDHMSYLSGWLEGAVLSAHAVVAKVNEHARQE